MRQKFIVGIDLGGTNTKIGLLTRDFQIRDKVIFSTQQFNSKNKLISAVCLRISEMLNKHSIEKKEVLGIGIGLPGPIDSQRGIVHYFPNIPGWKNVKLSAIMKKYTGIPVLIDNDVNLITLAEFKKGAGKGAYNVVCLTLGTGVGGGIIVEGRLFRGSSLSAGEIGHIPISKNGPRCGCGARGCLESYIGNRAILRKVNKLFGAVSLEEITKKARAGNKKAIAIWEEVGKSLGFALSGIVNFFNPDRIVIGGGISSAGGVLFKAITEEIRKRAMKPARDIVKIVKARLGEDAGIIGAALLFLN
jgi:glucokinase